MGSFWGTALHGQLRCVQNLSRASFRPWMGISWSILILLLLMCNPVIPLAIIPKNKGSGVLDFTVSPPSLPRVPHFCLHKLFFLMFLKPHQTKPGNQIPKHPLHLFPTPLHHPPGEFPQGKGDFSAACQLHIQVLPQLQPLQQLLFTGRGKYGKQMLVRSVKLVLRAGPGDHVASWQGVSEWTPWEGTVVTQCLTLSQWPGVNSWSV